ncbi:OadG family protein [Marinilabilia rubra]|uniref:Oxaloacetate decarboxylase n=1 Tax=Marinilabilia rubra TaxID=2162893 RepID=A0A2U2B5L5_9BACT|nr:OadG family protein [Marinilabilia rubra]PWD98345.1 hypothetical protein DDZ16_16345 [Marinilabilia rubra]
MEEGFNQALILLGVGMLTVFSVLLFVVLIGNGIIFFTNRFFPEFETTNNKHNGNSDIDSTKMAAIVAAVKKVSGGKGRIVKINRK